MLKERIKRFYNKTVGSIEEMAAAIALIHNLNLNLSRGESVLLGLTVPIYYLKWWKMRIRHHASFLVMDGKLRIDTASRTIQLAVSCPINSFKI